MGIREEVYYDGGPHVGDLILGILAGFTLILIPFTVGAIVRALWLRYRITNRRVSVTGGWLGRSRSDVVYSEIVTIKSVPRGWGAWGDMVITLKNGNQLEMRSVPNFREVVAYIEQRVADKAKKATAASATS
ncbi:MAG: PH domain-containing protein [Cyanobacteria bacterium]|nr:PH domain-containing protein [Cyanobacteriota bacterium]MDW8200839.1 PH domain-containing protein [Cyanobacteriota bacterium SKYGB_h_bin112]